MAFDAFSSLFEEENQKKRAAAALHVASQLARPAGTRTEGVHLCEDRLHLVLKAQKDHRNGSKMSRNPSKRPENRFEIHRNNGSESNFIDFHSLRARSP